MSSSNLANNEAPEDASSDEGLYTNRYRIGALLILVVVNLFNYMDRAIIGVLIEPIKAEFSASDTQMGILTGLAFAVFYAVCGFPIARIADRGYRVKVVSWSLAIWSGMTMLSGLVVSYWQLLIARMGVGVGEAGGNPPSQALIAEYFPMSTRARALSVYAAGATVGTYMGVLFAGYLGETYGWRTAFLVMGAPGVLFAIVVRLVLKEPPFKNTSSAAELPPDSMWGSIIILFRGRAFRHIMIAVGLLWFGNLGAGSWHAPFLQRSHGLSLSEVGVYLSVLGIPALASLLLGGYIGDRLTKRDPIWMVYVPIISTLISLPFMVGFYLAPTWEVAFGLLAAATFFGSAFIGVLVAAIQSLVGARARALAAAISMFVSNLIGLGLGPFAVGAISDLLSNNMGTDSLRWALILMKVMPLIAVFHLYLAAKTFREDLVESP